MNKIATHNSATGERGTFWSWFVMPFSKTQSKTLHEQWRAGCRYFDLRIRETEKDGWCFAHGLWKSKVNVYDTLVHLQELSRTDKANPTYAFITYEGKYKEWLEGGLINFARFYDAPNYNFYITSVDAKYSGTKKNPFIVDYKHIDTLHRCPIPSKQGFVPLDGKTWQTYLPIPWLWNKLFTRKHEFNDHTFIFVDFL